MGIVKEIPELKKQAEQLKDLLDEGDGFFIHNFKEEYFNGWSIYHGLALENDWKQGREYDLTFRALLMLHLSGYYTSTHKHFGIYSNQYQYMHGLSNKIGDAASCIANYQLPVLCALFMRMDSRSYTAYPWAD